MSREDKLIAHAIGIVIVILAMGAFFLHDYNVKRVEEFKVSTQVYCPTTSKIIKGDGVYTFDRSSPLARRRVEVDIVSEKYIYTTAGESFSIDDCRIRRE